MADKTPVKGNVRIKKEDKGYVVFNLDTSGFHLLTEDGINILNKCDGKNSAADIAKLVADELVADEQEVKKEIKVFLDDLMKRKIIKWKE
ncbi:MAG: PqqD family protein [Minisyncoccales bacterium]|jgi:hypothetical protein